LLLDYYRIIQYIAAILAKKNWYNTTHAYDEETSRKMERLIKEKYFPVMKDFYEKLKTEARP